MPFSERSERMTPLLNVDDVTSCLAWLKGIGFELVETDEEWQGPGIVHWALLERDGAVLMVNRRPMKMPQNVAIYLRVADPDALHEELRGKGYSPPPIEEAPYGMREFWLDAPFGVTFAFGCPSEGLTPSDG